MRTKLNERTILAAEKNLIKYNKLSDVNFEALKDAYIYDSSASIRALIAFLKKMKEVIISGKPVRCDIRGEINIISNENEFYEFVNKHFEDIKKDI